MSLSSPSDTDFAGPAAAAPDERAALEAKIGALVRPAIEAEAVAGLAIGVLDPAGTAVFGYGRSGPQGGTPSATTIFEIGSVTKVFTSLLLADMVERKLVSLEDPVAPREGDRLMVQATGQDRYRVYADSETEFRYKVVPARITFVTNEDGRATGLVLHQNGRDMPAKKQ